LLASFLAAVVSVVLEVPGYGTISGGSGTSYHYKRPFHSFYRLYFGEEPTNLTRFLPPVPVGPLPDGEIYDASIQGPGCPQPTGNENCLLVNVFSPKLPGNASDPETIYDNLLPVVFWIYGGAFSFGSNILYSSTKYMDQDVVLVEVQYRLGPLGFLSLGTDEAPGNAGIFDQIEGLRWTRQFIKYFGGDPNSVTLIGESAGGVSVALLMLAPQARGLFHRAIAESGSALAPWAIDRDQVGNARKVADIAGCPLDPYEQLLDCLRNIPSDELMRAYTAFQKNDWENGGMGFGASSPVIQIAGAERLLEKEPRELLETGQYATDVPLLMGANSQEGTLILGIAYNNFLVSNNLTDDYEFLKNDLVGVLLNTLGIADETGAVAQALTDKYLAGAELGNFTSMSPGLIDLCSVLFIKDGGYQTVAIHSKFNPNSYWYAFDYKGRFGLLPLFFAGNMPPFDLGIAHADELLYLFAFPTYANNATEATLSKRMLQVWTTFAAYGEPTPDGVPMLDGIPAIPAYTDEEQAYVRIAGDWSVEYDYSLTYTITADSQRSRRSP
jgi:carboxylesterase type B